MYCTFPWQLQMFITLTDVISVLWRVNRKLKNAFFIAASNLKFFFENKKKQNVNYFFFFLVLFHILR